MDRSRYSETLRGPAPVFVTCELLDPCIVFSSLAIESPVRRT